jgi:hypothetical protein
VDGLWLLRIDHNITLSGFRHITRICVFSRKMVEHHVNNCDIYRNPFPKKKY